MMNVARGKGQAEAQELCGYGAITLRREGNRAVVEIEFQGESIPVIAEDLDGNFCHTIEPSGIWDTIRSIPT